MLLQESRSSALRLSSVSESPPQQALYARLVNSAAHDSAVGLIEPRLLLELVGQFSPTDRVHLHFERYKTSWRFAVATDCLASDKADAEALFETLLAVVAPGAQFKLMQPPAATPGLAVQKLAPCATIVRAVDAESIWLPPAPLNHPDLGRTLRAAAAYDIERVSFSIAPFSLSAAERASIEAARLRLKAGAPAPSSSEHSQLDILNMWLAANAACQLGIELTSPKPLLRQQQDVLCAALFGRAARTCVGTPVADLRLALPAGTLPSFRFWPASPDFAPTQRRVREVAAGPGVITLGHDAADEAARLPARDRNMHTAVWGGTGAGKTTALTTWILEDIANGEGVFVVDVHGDMSERIKSSLPEHRRDDLVWIDAADEALAWRLDPLATTGCDPLRERSRLANNFISFFRQLYGAVPESMGPAFEQYFGFTFKLLLSARAEEDRVLTKFDDVLLDRRFRTKLLSECDDPKVRQFWEDSAELVTGENNLDNIAPYITNKMAQISSNPLTAAVISGDKPRLDLRWAMDNRKVVLVRLPKGVIGEYDARFLGALFLMTLAQAASSRANMLESTRTPFRVYIDEFADLATKAAADMLAEMRKFGLSLVLANQNLSQLTGGKFSQASVAQAMLANCATFVLFRLSPADADLLASIVSGVSAHELTQLGVGEIVVRRLLDGVPLHAERLRTLLPSTEAV